MATTWFRYGIGCLLLYAISGQAQDPVDAGRPSYPAYASDSVKVISALMHAENVVEQDPFQALQVSNQALELTRKMQHKRLILRALNVIGSAYWIMGDYAEDEEITLERLDIARQLKDTADIIHCLDALASDNFSLKEWEQSEQYRIQAMELARQFGDLRMLARVYINAGDAAKEQGQYTKAVELTQKALEYRRKTSNDPMEIGFCLMNLGEIYAAQRDYDQALLYTRQAYEALQHGESVLQLSYLFENFGEIYQARRSYVEAEDYYQKSLEYARQMGAKDQIKRAYERLSVLAEEQGQLKEALQYRKSFEAYNDSLFNEKKLFESKRKLWEKELNASRQKIIDQQADIKRTQVMNLFLAVTGIFSLAGIGLLWSLMQQKRQANRQLRLHNQEMQQQQEEIRSQNEKLEEKNQELDRLNREKSSLVQIVAHDLKSPLNQIKGLVRIIRMEEPPMSEIQSDCLGRIEVSATKLTEMINKILDVEAIEANKVRMNMERLNLTDMLITLIHDHQHVADFKNIHLELHFEQEPIFAMLDSSHATQVFDNLVSNAIKFSPHNKNVFIRARQQGNKAIVEIQDQGPGFSPEDMGKLFQKFQRLSATPTAGEKSTGLGLSIVKKYVESMNGRVWCESVHGQGATFLVAFEAN